jgi:hypothetical protein
MTGFRMLRGGLAMWVCVYIPVWVAFQVGERIGFEALGPARQLALRVTVVLVVFAWAGLTWGLIDPGPATDGVEVPPCER